MDIPTITAAIESIKIVKAAFNFLLNQKIDEAARQKINEALEKFGEIQASLFQIREENFALQTKNEELRKELSRHDDWDKKISEYKLTKTEGGAVVYSFNGQPQHYVCPRCASSKREIHILQDMRDMTGHFKCPNCANEFPINP